MKSHHCFCQHVRHHSWSKKVEDQSFLHWSSHWGSSAIRVELESVKCIAESRSREVLLSSVDETQEKFFSPRLELRTTFYVVLLIEGFLHTFEVELLDPRESGGNWEIIVGTGTQGKQGLSQITSSSVSSTLTYTLILQNWVLEIVQTVLKAKITGTLYNYREDDDPKFIEGGGRG